jgi:23S rRNA pseudouridine1911/1915/1917 synthase
MGFPENGPDDYSAGLLDEPDAGQELQLVVPDAGVGSRLDVVLAALIPEHSRSRIQEWIRGGLVSVDGLCRQEPKLRVDGGERVVVVVPEDVRASPDQAEDIPLAIVFEDDSLIVIDKPVGLVVHPGSGNWSGTLLNALLHHAPELAAVPRAGIVHRLDKDTSGLLVVARTLTAQTHLVRQLQARTVRREYLALVRGRVAAGGEVDAPIGRHPTQRTRMAVVDGGKPARTRYRVLERFEACALLECSLDTGRTHQIRVHMASIGLPLVGDATYGPRARLPPAFARQALHAARLGLLHPLSGQSMQWESPLPADFAGLLESLRGAWSDHSRLAGAGGGPRLVDDACGGLQCRQFCRPQPR